MERDRGMGDICNTINNKKYFKNFRIEFGGGGSGEVGRMVYIFLLPHIYSNQLFFNLTYKLGICIYFEDRGKYLKTTRPNRKFLPPKIVSFFYCS